MFDVPARYNFVRNGVHIVLLTRRNGVCMSFVNASGRAGSAAWHTVSRLG